MSRITLHPDYGVNPSLDLCFWCGEAHGVALLGYNRGKEAPRSMVSSYDPCKKCEGVMEQGITLVEASHHPLLDGQPALQPGVYPTGSWSVVTEDAARRAFTPDVIDAVLQYRKAFVSPDTYAALGLKGTTVQHDA